MPTKTVSGFQLSPLQKRLWLLQQYNSTYCTQCAIFLEGNLNPEVLKAALQQVINRHGILRTSFRRLSGIKIPVMVIADSSVLVWHEINLSDCEPQEQEAKFEAIFQQQRRQNFDFEQDPLLSASLLTLSLHKYILIISLPSLCADTWTLKNLVAEISYSYSACLQSEIVSEEVVQYLQFSEWQNQLLEDENAEIAHKYWQEQKLPSQTILRLPFESQAAKQTEFQLDSFRLTIAPDVTAKAATLARKHNTSTVVVLLACWQTLIWRLIGESEIIIGMASDRREYEELHEVLGLIATWIPIKSQLTPDLCFQEVLKLNENTLTNNTEWQDYYTPESVGNENNLVFPIGFEFEQLPEKHFANSVSFSLEKYYSCIEPFKVKLTCTQHGETLNAEFYYDVNYFSPDSIQRLAGHFQTLLNHATNNPDKKISQLDIISKSDRQQLLVEFNQTQIDYPKDKCIHQIFEEQVEKTPNNIALVFEDQQLTYAELNRKANQLARYLQTLGVKPEVIVGLCVERSLEMIIGLLGILKAGGAYLPLDPTLPKESLDFRLQDAQASLVINLDTDWNIISQYDDDNPSSEVTTENLVYVVFTSGSTGKPKGVAIEHQQLVNYLNSITERLNLPTAANFASVSTLAADLGNTVIFPSLCTGGTLHIISSQRVADSAALAEYNRQHSIECLKIVPSHLASLLASAPSQSILPHQRLILGGEVATWDLIEQIQQQAPDCLIFNHYGPTEATVGVTTFAVQNNQASHNSKTVPLGRPLGNIQIYLLDQQLQPVPIGVPGELYIGGASLVRGYLNRPELTAERFIANTFGNSKCDRLYKTGDLARYLPDGNIEFIGRLDNQVKIRGFRIELSEIETVLCQHPEVQQAVVLLREDKRLIAYIIPKQKQTPSVSNMHRFVREKLPEYMMPSAFVILKVLPLMPNGKVNRSALPEPDGYRPELEATYQPPQTEIEEAITIIWQEALNVQKVGINDNFFELGGHSLLIVQIHSKLRQLFNQDLSITDLFEHPTISSLVKFLNPEKSEESSLEESHNRAKSRMNERQLRTQFRQKL
ncbi:MULTISPECIES: non-ribosomal peptide synthetase [Nostoc]|uniref:Amino acid adenylation domain-containing protein n=1 Tax=Nostoc punctiforme FACHB-252 TaxID=1357509 RepID=A0ABR8HL06_NOSPU|nr:MULTISPECIES: non-ribosomal peptide synthetase [Nostoc]MBC1236343.1 amino acid adenylation domain-containing protein [Nostoc sp. 2RC]MBD2615680.1 amino acid adenylation domain-containing protein [Nostoc punctiforme FACHB-252]